MCAWVCFDVCVRTLGSLCAFASPSVRFFFFLYVERWFVVHTLVVRYSVAHPVPSKRFFFFAFECCTFWFACCAPEWRTILKFKRHSQVNHITYNQPCYIYLYHARCNSTMPYTIGIMLATLTKRKDSFSPLFMLFTLGFVCVHPSVRLCICGRMLQLVNIWQVDILVATHAVLTNASTSFKKLGLAVVDEEQRFGVEQRERLTSKVFCFVLN